MISRRGFLAILIGVPFGRAFTHSTDTVTVDSVSAMFHIPPQMIGILERATFEDIREQHTQLYIDCLGPWLAAFDSRLAVFDSHPTYLTFIPDE